MRQAFLIAVIAVLVIPSGDRPHSRLLAQQADASAGTGVVYGRTLDGTTGAAVGGTVVTLTRAVAGGPRPVDSTVLADAQGRFVFSGVPAGEFRLQASKPGWRAGAFGLDRPADGLGTGHILDVPRGGRVNVTIPVWRNAVVSGRVTDETGEPMAGASVQAARWFVVAGRRRLGTAASARTDDRGLYTLSVQAGDVMISASSQQVRVQTAESDVAPGRRQLFQRTFYPGVPGLAGAVVLTLDSGDERHGIDIRLPLVPAVRVSGVLRNPSPSAPMPRRVELVHEDEVSWQYAAQVDAQGRFAFDAVLPGRYVLQTGRTAFPAQAPSAEREWWARTIVDAVDRDIEMIADLHRPLRVTGRVQFDGAGLPVAGLSAGVTLLPDNEPAGDVVPPAVPVDSSGRFTIDTTPGRFIVSARLQRQAGGRPDLSPDAVQATQAWRLRSAMHGGRDVADAPLVLTGDASDLVLTFTDRWPRLRGRVTTRQGSVESSVVIAFPMDESLWADFGGGRRLQTVRVPREGTFDMTRLPAGDYFVAAVRGAPYSEGLGGPDDRALRSAAFLRELTRTATRVTLHEGDVHTETLQLVEAPAVSAALAPPSRPLDTFEGALVRDAPPLVSAGSTISGRVLAAGSNQPLASVRVGLTPNAEGTYTDQQGRFVLTGVPAGRHTLHASRPSYVSTTYGAARPGGPGTPIAVAGGEHVTGVTIPMTSGAAIGGTVLDHNGLPLANAQVALHRWQWQARGPELVRVRAPGQLAPAITTNAYGQYRAYGLPPGDYVVSVEPSGPAASSMPVTTPADVSAASASTPAAGPLPERPRVRHATTFYPSTTDPGAAETVRLASGDDRALDFQVPLVSTGAVSGFVLVPQGVPLARVSVGLSPNDLPGGSVPPSTFGSIDATGAFTIRGVAPGRYTLATRSLQTGAPRLFGSVDLLVNGDLDGVVLDLQPSGAIGGRVRTDSVPGLGETRNVRIALSALTRSVNPFGQSLTAALDADGRFAFDSVPPGRYRLELTGPAAASRPRVASQRVAGRETIDTGLEVRGGARVDVDVTLTTSEAQLTGVARDRAGQPTAAPFVVLFASDPQAWTPPSRRIFATRPDQNGRYLFPDVPPGAYLLGTLLDAEEGDWFNPGLLADLAATAAPLTLERSDRQQIDVSLPRP